jgi:trk system potassium uptake protein TrkH
MFIGSMSYSTAGGIKVVRFIVLLRRFKTYILSLLSGGSITQDVILGEDVLDEREVSNIVLFILLHFISVLTGASLLKSMIPEVDYLDALFEATSAASCVGLSAGLTSPNMPLGAKVTLMTLMYFGRLEYTPLLVLLGLILYREYRILKHR